jgi:hypothetical protein
MAVITRVSRPALLEHVLQGERVDHRAEHPHVVGADAVHPHARELRAAHDVAAADHEPTSRRLDDLLICSAKKLSRSKSKPNFVSPASASPESLSSTRG